MKRNLYWIAEFSPLEVIALTDNTSKLLDLNKPRRGVLPNKLLPELYRVEIGTFTRNQNQCSGLLLGCPTYDEWPLLEYIEKPAIKWTPGEVEKALDTFVYLWAVRKRRGLGIPKRYYAPRTVPLKR